ncbi:VOC family protein [Aeromicrobium flavum]|uniref:VOC family protein n=1 Tax=Aeromicrobium flavum TaxID=416568 RepID=A0A512HUQ1_9ACTN|nr:VOC family protein [Aeromicrobium flavum]GEO89161.1 VOC family protein [Aeromicrobium flavum]
MLGVTDHLSGSGIDMAINAYLFFSGGTCAEAFAHYGEVFGGEAAVMRTSEVPEEARMPGADPDSVMHASLRIGDDLLMGSDDPTGDGGPKMGFSVSYTAPDATRAREVFDALAAGGEVTMALAPTFWTSAFGMCIDRFGTPWMVDVEDDSAGA